MAPAVTRLNIMCCVALSLGRCVEKQLKSGVVFWVAVVVVVVFVAAVVSFCFRDFVLGLWSKLSTNPTQQRHGSETVDETRVPATPPLNRACFCYTTAANGSVLWQT